MGIPLPEDVDGLNDRLRRLVVASHELFRESGEDAVETRFIVRKAWDNDGLFSPLDYYAILLRHTQDWIARYPLFEAEGNVGSIDGDLPASMQLNRVGPSDWFQSLPVKGSGNWPSCLPYLLANGALGHTGQTEPSVVPNTSWYFDTLEPICRSVPTGGFVGGDQRSFIPPHNLNELSKALLHLLRYPKASLNDVLQFVQGPDFPTRGLLTNAQDLPVLYECGEGELVIRARTTLKEGKKGRGVIVISEIPYGVTKMSVVEKMAIQAHSNPELGIADIRDLSPPESIRIEVEVKDSASGPSLMELFYQGG